MYRCIVRYGYRDVHKDDDDFEKNLASSIAEFIRSFKTPKPAPTGSNFGREDEKMTVVGTSSAHSGGVQISDDANDNRTPSPSPGASGARKIRSPQGPVRARKKVRFIVPESPEIDKAGQEELHELMEAQEAGIAYIMGHSYVRAKPGSGLVKRVVINLGYEFLRRNSRTLSYGLSVPHASTLEVGMLYHV